MDKKIFLILKRNNYFFLEILLLIFSYALIFNHIGRTAIRMWDESVYVNNALEMFYNGDYLIKYFNGKPEMWGTQPPLVAWLQVICLKIFGLKEWVFRIPSALAITGVGFLMLNVSKYLFKNKYIGFLSALVFWTTEGIIRRHVARTADLDASLVFFTFATAIFLYKYLQDKKIKNLYFSTLFLIASVYTKSVAGLLFMPGLLLFLFYTKKLKLIFLNKHFYFCILLFFISIFSYYIARETQNEGYLMQVWKNEMGGRFFEVNEGHQEKYNYYFDLIYSSHFKSWVFFIFLGLSFPFIKKLKKFKQFIIFCFVNSLVFLLVLSSSETKIGWYEAPAYPYLSFIVGIAIYFIIKSFINFLEIKNWKRKIVSILLFLSIFYYPVDKIIKKNIAEKNTWGEELFGHFIKEIEEKNSDIKKLTFLITNWHGHAIFYKTLYEKKGYEIEIRSIRKKVEVMENEYIVFWHNDVIKHLKKDYNFELIQKKNYKKINMFLIKVNLKK